MPVYFIRAGESGPVKIGIADDVSARLRELQTAHHESLLVVRTVDGAQDLEAAFHAAFRDRHIRGEWFSWDDRMLNACPEITPKALPALAVGSVFDAHGVTDAEIASGIGASREAVRLWRKGIRRVSSDRAIEIEQKFNIPRASLRPDLWSAA
jgi:hypothetical protein